jgi:hypothetical protein
MILLQQTQNWKKRNGKEIAETQINLLLGNLWNHIDPTHHLVTVHTEKVSHLEMQEITQKEEIHQWVDHLMIDVILLWVDHSLIDGILPWFEICPNAGTHPLTEE